MGNNIQYNAAAHLKGESSWIDSRENDGLPWDNKTKHILAFCLLSQADTNDVWLERGGGGGGISNRLDQRRTVRLPVKLSSFPHD